VGFIPLQVAHATNESPFKWGYDWGLQNGKASIREGEIGVCDDVYTNSTSDDNSCSHGYDLGFKQGCDLGGNKIPGFPNPEYGTCREYFSH
jgi:hypothetical protein